MGEIFVDFDAATPRFACTSCFECTSIIGSSLCRIKNRGCCWYYPKFNLYDIQKMCRSIEGLQTLDTIIHNPGSTIYQYYIHAKGYFDKDGYEAFIKSGGVVNDVSYDNLLEDETIYFRACPFVKEGYGCTIPGRFRSHICNFFICDEVIQSAGSDRNFKRYIDVRSTYSKWIQWEDSSLQYILTQNKVNLINNFDKTIEILQSLPFNEYEFPALQAVEYDDTFSREA